MAKDNDALTLFLLFEGALAMVLVASGALKPSIASTAAPVARTG